MPEFVHLPLLLKPVGNGKLSKRDGDKLGFPVFPLEWHDPNSGEVSSGYREQGYLPEAVVNFLALLGWNPGDDTELMDMDGLVRKFSFAHCSKAGAKFDYQKAAWFNREYITRLPDDEVARLFMPVLKDKGIEGFSPEYVAKAAGVVKGRVNFIGELWDQGDFFFRAPEEYAPKDVKKRWGEDTPRIMEELVGVLEGIEGVRRLPTPRKSRSTGSLPKAIISATSLTRSGWPWSARAVGRICSTSPSLCLRRK